MELLSSSYDDPFAVLVGCGVLHGMPGESVHCQSIEDDEVSVQLTTSLKDDHDLQCPLEDEQVLTMNQAIGYFIRWPQSDLRRAPSVGVAPAVGAVGALGGVAGAVEATSGDPKPAITDNTKATTRAAAKKLKSPPPEKKAPSKRNKSKEEAANPKKRLAFEAVEVSGHCCVFLHTLEAGLNCNLTIIFRIDFSLYSVELQVSPVRSRCRKVPLRSEMITRSRLEALTQAIAFLYPRDDDSIVYTGRSWGFGEVSGSETGRPREVLQKGTFTSTPPH